MDTEQLANFNIELRALQDKYNLDLIIEDIPATRKLSVQPREIPKKTKKAKKK